MSDVKKWLGPNPNRQVKQVSFRPAVDVAAKLAALDELFENRNRTELINDMLLRALKEVEREIMEVGGTSPGPDGEEHYDDLSMWNKYKEFYEKHLEYYQNQAGGKDE